MFWAPKHPSTFGWGVLGDKTPHQNWGVMGNFVDGVFWKWDVFGCIHLNSLVQDFIFIPSAVDLYIFFWYKVIIWGV